MVRRMIELNPHHPGWLHTVLHNDAIRRGEYAEARMETRRTSMSEFAWTYLIRAQTAFLVGEVDEMRQELGELFRRFPMASDPEVMRDVGERWIQDPEHRRHLSEVRVKMMAALQSAG
jgi:hypothetical protein